jgi:hypothetical protein
MKDQLVKINDRFIFETVSDKSIDLIYKFEDRDELFILASFIPDNDMPIRIIDWTEHGNKLISKSLRSKGTLISPTKISDYIELIRNFKGEILW